jgi:hypothetical protein
VVLVREVGVGEESGGDVGWIVMVDADLERHLR